MIMSDTTTHPTGDTDSNAATVLLDLESLIKQHIASIERTKQEFKKQKEMFNDIFANDATYKEHENKVKEANKVKLATRSELMKQPGARALSEKVKEMAVEIKEFDTALSDYLREYQRLSGSNEIEGDDGEIHEIIYLAKLVKKSKYRP